MRRCISATDDRLQHVGESLEIQEGQLPAAKETYKRLEALRLDMESLERIEEDMNKARVEVAWLLYYNNVEVVGDVLVIVSSFVPRPPQSRMANTYFPINARQRPPPPQTETIASELAMLEKQVKKLQNELEKAQAEAAQRLAASEGLETETAALNAQLEDARSKWMGGWDRCVDAME